jgi:hypothetical protein
MHYAMSFGHFELSVYAEVGSVPISSTPECQDVVNLHRGNNVIVVLKPLIT